MNERIAQQVENDVRYGYPPPPAAPRRNGLLISTIAFGVALALALLAAGLVITGLQNDLSRTEDTLSATRSNLGETEGTLAETRAELDSANSKAAACEKAADLLQRGANEYARLWNQVDNAADRWRFVFDFYLYRLLNSPTEVSSATLNAGWRAHKDCRAGGSTVAL